MDRVKGLYCVDHVSKEPWTAAHGTEATVIFEGLICLSADIHVRYPGLSASVSCLWLSGSSCVYRCWRPSSILGWLALMAEGEGGTGGFWSSLQHTVAISETPRKTSRVSASSTRQKWLYQLQGEKPRAKILRVLEQDLFWGEQSWLRECGLLQMLLAPSGCGCTVLGGLFFQSGLRC